MVKKRNLMFVALSHST